MDSADADCATQEQLDLLAPLVSDQLGLPVAFHLIPYGRTLNEQINILQIITTNFSEGDEVSLDVTHGLRHLPMLTLVSSMYLQAAYKVVVKGIYYGALDMTVDQKTPVMELDGLLSITDWISALRAFDKDGDYGVFTPLLEGEGLAHQEAEHLRKAAFFERNFNVSRASGELNNFNKNLEDDLPGIGQLFTQQLRERIQWHRRTDMYARQRQLAEFYLEQSDYPRATIFAYEAFITNLIDREAGERDFDYDDRDFAKNMFIEGLRGDPSLKNFFLKLGRLRNALAHGNEPQDKEVKKILRDEQNLKENLSRLMKRLLNA
jgi:CRISPR-associated DxTHG motif protein